MKDYREEFIKKYNACETNEERSELMRAEIKDIQQNLKRLDEKLELKDAPVSNLYVEVQFDYDRWLSESLERIGDYITVSGVKMGNG